MSEGTKNKGEKPIETGVKCIQGYLKNLPNTPGVYRMLSEGGEVLYVGKAKALKKRVSSYTKFNTLSIRIQRMVAQTREMEFIHTHTEAEALLLESNLIKKHQPRYNILLRDDKSFPYILITDDHDYPQVVKHRGAKKRAGKYYGPFASAGDVNRTIATLQRAFMLRNCTDSYFSARNRPCLQYHIKRCTAPCVGHVDKGDYAEQVAQAKDFLDGKSKAVQDHFSHKMQEASESQNYELAAEYRDRVKALTAIQSRQNINVNIADLKDVDVIGLHQSEGKSCVQVFFFRAGRNFGNRSYFPRHDKEDKPHHVLSAFMAQFYENKPVPREIIVSHTLEEKALLEKALGSKINAKVTINNPSRGTRKRILDFVLKNADNALKRNLAESAAQSKLLYGVSDLFNMEDTPQRIEIYDNSHISGTNMVGAMIVAGPEGFQKNAYRKFNIKTAAASDDYGMMREIMERRFGRALKEGKDRNSDDWPDLLLIDGGQGQFNSVKDVLEDFGVLDQLTLVSIAKGEDRHAGREKFFIEGRVPFQLPENDPVLHYLQRLRDEAHRFAIGSHRVRRSKDIVSSPLDDIAGVGAKRKKALLLYFGSAKAVSQAGVDDLAKVDGISKAVAQKIYDYFH